MSHFFNMCNINLKGELILVEDTRNDSGTNNMTDSRLVGDRLGLARDIRDFTGDRENSNNLLFFFLLLMLIDRNNFWINNQWQNRCSYWNNNFFRD